MTTQHYNEKTMMPESFSAGQRCVTVGTMPHGSYIYKTVAAYEAVQSSRGPYLLWKKIEVLAEATTEAKITRLAHEWAEKLSVPFIRGVRHHDLVVPQC